MSNLVSKSDMTSIVTKIKTKLTSLFASLIDVNSRINNILNDIAPPFESTEDYNEGDVVNYENITYIFTTHHDAGAFDESEVTEYVLSHDTSLKGLKDVSLDNVSNGQVLKYNSTTGKWRNANESGGGGGSSTLAGLDDVTISSPALGNILAYDGEKWINYAASGNGMFIAAYGKSTYAEILAAYQSRMIVYCRASSSSNPASGAQTRMAFLAYVNNETTPTEFEFQYYRSVATHSDSQQGDQVFVYKINSSGTWSVTTRSAFTKIAAGTNMSSSYSNGVLTLNSTASGGTTVVANPSGTASTNLNKLQVGSSIYAIPSGTTVVANPSGTAGSDLNKVQIGSSIYGIPQPTANPSGTASADLTKLQIGSTIYSISGATANPSGTATDDLTKIQIGSTIYAIPSANLGDVDNFVLVNDLPSDAASHPRTMYLITEE